MRSVMAMTFCAGLLAACTLDVPPDALDSGPAVKMRVSGVPFHAQEGFGCGPASISMMLGWAGVDVAPAALTGRFYGNAKDPRPTLVDTARRYGRFAYPVKGVDALVAEVAAGHPVLVLENLGVSREPIWNCPVAVGYDGGTGRILLNSGAERAKTVSLSLLERLWSDTDGWGLVVLRPGELPATASEASFVEAARALEQGGNYWEAVRAYDAALSQWPADMDALMGLGTSLYLLGDPRGAIEAFEAASRVGKDPKPALDAIAHVAAELRRPDTTEVPVPHRPLNPVPGSRQE